MSGLFSTLNTANKGLFAQQTGLHTSSHNIANANTKGYTRQRVEMKADIAYNLVGVGQLGTGVKSEGIIRVTNEYVTGQIRNETGILERYTSKSEVIDQLEVIFNEPSNTGLNFYIGEMFDSWQELSMNPESLTSKSIVVDKSEALADTINTMVRQINSLKQETIGQIEKNSLDFNSTIDELDSLNQQIMNVSIKGQAPNDLLDQRDLMLLDLASIANVNTSFDEYGRVSIQLKDSEETIDILGFDSQDQPHELSVITGIEENDGGYAVTISKGGNSLEPSVVINVTKEELGDLEVGQVLITSKADLDDDSQFDNIVIKDSKDIIKSGKIKGNTEALGDIDKSLASMKKFTDALVEAINTIHTAGVGEDEIAQDLTELGQDGKDYLNFFVYDEESGQLMVNQSLQDQPEHLQVGKEPNGPEGDGSRALAIARLRNTKLNLNGEKFTYIPEDMSIVDSPGGITIEDAYANIVTNIGISKEHSDNKIANQNVLLGQLEMRREAQSGVSINEEITNVIKYQKAYEANARVISVLTEMLDVLINRTGV